jgi:uncharacterized repeat protein (TIGR01451 family)
MRPRRKWWMFGGAQSRRPKQPGRKLRIERWGGSSRSLSLEALELRTMLTGHPLILPTVQTSSFVAADTATAPVAPVPIGWTPSSTNLADPVNGPLAKGGPALVDLYQQYLTTQQPGATTPLATVVSKYTALQFSGDSVALELVSSGSVDFATFVSDLEALGAQPTTISDAYNAVDAYVPIASLGSIAELSEVAAMSPSIRPTTHIAYDPGVGGPPMNVPAVKAQGITGTGVKVGVISDSINNAGGLTTGQADGFLPGVQVLGDETDGQGTDEGAAMLEEVHAIAPGATLAFDTGGDTQLSMSQAVTALSNVGAKVITDDLGFDDEPFFEPGIIDDAIGTAVSNGAIYLGAAGNAGNDGFYEASNWTLVGANYVFNWNGGSTTNPAGEMAFTAAVDGGTELDVEWDNSYNGVAFNGVPGSKNILDNVQVQIDYLDPINGPTPIAPESIANGFTGGEANAFATGMPFQSFFLPLDGEYVISATIQNSPGGLLTPTSALPDALEFVTQDIGNTLSSFSIGSTAPPGFAITTYGHSAGPNTIGVGAVDAANPTVSDLYSAFGPAFYYFDSNGNRIAGGPTTELNPFISAPDDIDEDVNYPEFYPFQGTSAAAANAAGAAALLVSADATLNQAELEKVLIATSTPVNGQTQGTWNDQSGYGLINVDAAFNDLTVVNNSPEMDVTSGGQDISYGEISPSTLNNTDFGSTSDAGGMVTETYTITNVGKSNPLDLTSLTITPTSTLTGFTVSQTFSSATLDPGQTATFQIEFTPTAAGVATATVSIASNDSLNPTPFTFEITGTATAPQTTMELVGNGHDIAYNSSSPSSINDTYFGSTFDNGAALSETFTIVNGSATLPLTITSVSVAPTASSAIAGFSITAGAGAATIAAGMSETFTIVFTPSGVAGVATATVSIVSDDASNPIPFIFEISATSLMPVSSMEVEGENNQVIVDGAPPAVGNGTNFGTVLDNGATGTQVFTLVSNGQNLPLNISSITVVPTIGSGFTVSAPLLTSVPAGSSTTFTVTFTPTAPGTDLAEIEIFSSDSSHPSPFTFDITGTAVNPPPTIVSQIDDSNTTGFSLTGTWSTYSAGVNGSEHYAAAGTGTAQANYTFTGLTPGQYEVLSTWAPMPNAASNAPYTFYDGGQPVGSAVVNQSVAPNGSVVAGYQVIGLVNITSSTLRVALTNDANGAVIADTVEIGFLPHLILKNPELVVSDDLTGIASNATPEVANGTDFGSTTIKTGSTIHTFTLTNNGLATLTFGSTPVRAVGASFSIVSQPAVTSLAPGASTRFQVEFAPTATGLQTGSIAISTNDPNYSGGFELFLQGTGVTTATTAAKAQIAVSGDGVNIAKGAAALTANGTNFGGATVSTGSVTETYTITNAGGTTLTLTGSTPVTVSGSAGSGFTLVSQPAVDSLAPGASVSFQVKFAPTTTGAKTGTISIASNDPVNPTYTVDIAGTGIAAASSQIAVSDNSFPIVPGGTPEFVNGTIFASATEVIGSSSSTFTITNNGKSTLTLTGGTPVSVVGAAFSVSSQPASDSLAPGASTTFTVKFSPTTVGIQTGTVTIASNDPQNGTFTFNVQGTGIAALSGLPSIIDDSGTGFSLVGPWSTTKFGFDGGEHYAAAGTGSAQASYSFTGLAPGQYQIFATWSDVGTPSKPATNAPFTIYNGTLVAGSATVNQDIAPSGASFDNTPFQLLGTVTITSSLLRVTLNNKANGIVLADAVAIVRVPTGDLSITNVDNLGGSSISGATGTAIPGKQITYTITATNFGPGGATDATVSDTFPAGISADTYTVAVTGGAADLTVPASGSGNIHDTVDIPSGGTITYTVTATLSPAATGLLSNVATITPPSSFFDANTANNTATDTDTLTPTVGLTIVKADNDGGSSVTSAIGSAVPGGQIKYTITVSNTGPSNAVGATVADALASIADLTSDTFTASGTAGASGFTASGSGSINDIVSLATGSSITYVVTANIESTAAGTLSNTATVTAASGETLAAGSITSATDTDNLLPTVILTITKADNDGGSSITGATGTAAPGAPITYTITVTNLGTRNAVGAVVADALATNSDFASDTYTATATAGATGFTASGSGSIHDTVNLAAGSSITYTVTAGVKSTATGVLSNTATIAAGSTQGLGVGSVGSAGDNDNLVLPVLLTITKTDNDGGSSATAATGSTVPGAPITYTVTVTNTGTSNALGAVVADALAANADLASDTYTATGTAGATGFTASGSGSINDTVNLAAGSSITYVVTADTKSSATGTLANVATVAAGSGQALGTGSVATATDNDTLVPTVALTVTKTDSDGGSSTTGAHGTAAPGSKITYTITVTNFGLSDAVGSVIADALAANADFASASYTATATGGATGFTASGTGSINDTVDLVAGSTVTYTVTAVIKPAATGTLSNTVTVIPGMGETLVPGSVTTAIDNDTLS